MTCSVLIVEDEFLVAMELEHILRQSGHTVVGIASDRDGANAVAGPVDIALVDMNLRDGPTGPKIAQDLTERHGARIIYVTANPKQIGTPSHNVCGLVQKPFVAKSILNSIDHAASRDMSAGGELVRF